MRRVMCTGPGLSSPGEDSVSSGRGSKVSAEVRERYRRRLENLRLLRAKGSPPAGPSSSASLDPAPV
eukprot:8363037-Lingulodinium_polyedra.AAC.1